MTQIDVHVNEPALDPEDTKELAPSSWQDSIIFDSTAMWTIAGTLGVIAFLLWMYPWGKVIVAVIMFTGSFLLAGLMAIAVWVKLHMGERRS